MRADELQLPKAESVPNDVFAAYVHAGTAASDDFTIGGTLMKKMLLLLSLGVLCSAVAFAQDSPTAGQSAPPSANTSSDSGSVQGCLSGTDGNYVLTEDGTGTSYKLVGSESQLKKHVGHEVEITGQPSNDSGSQASGTDQGQAQPSTNNSAGMTVQVSNVRMVSKQCRGSAGGAPESK